MNHRLVERLSAAVLVVLAAGGPLGAGDPRPGLATPDQQRRLVTSDYWPAGVPIRIHTGPFSDAKPISGLDQNVVAGSERQTSGSSGDPVGPRPAHAAPDPARVQTLKGELDRLEQTIVAIARSIVDLHETSGDVTRMLAGSVRQELLRPLLLFLVEKGVIRADEVEELLRLRDVELVLGRIRGRLRSLCDRRTALEVQRLFTQESLERLGAPEGGASPPGGGSPR